MLSTVARFTLFGAANDGGIEWMDWKPQILAIRYCLYYLTNSVCKPTGFGKTGSLEVIFDFYPPTFQSCDASFPPSSVIIVQMSSTYARTDAGIGSFMYGELCKR